MKNKTNYLVILNYKSSEVITIKLSRVQKAKAKTFVHLEDYVKSLEKEYRFRLEDCSWMASADLHERSYY